MEIKNRLFPYPVLCEDTDDYTEGEFVVDTEVVSQDINTLELRFRMNLDNPGLKGLISQGRAEYVIHIECSNTAFRTVIHTFSEEEVYRISNSRVNGEVIFLRFIYTDMMFFDFDFHRGKAITPEDFILKLIPSVFTEFGR